MTNHNKEKYGRLIIIEEIPPRVYSYGSYKMVRCKCDCGNEIEVRLSKINSGWTKSCGCLQKEVNLKRITTHGMRNTSTYLSWVAMKARCLRKSQDNFKYYGGRGIKICQRWLESFEDFLEDMGERPKDKTLDRIDNEKDYYKSNCKWSTMKEQCSNRRKKNGKSRLSN